MSGADAIAILLFVLVFKIFASPKFRHGQEEVVAGAPVTVVPLSLSISR